MVGLLIAPLIYKLVKHLLIMEEAPLREEAYGSVPVIFFQLKCSKHVVSLAIGRCLHILGLAAISMPVLLWGGLGLP